MKFFLDMPVAQRVNHWLLDRGFDAIHARDLGMNRFPDEDLLEYALKEGRILMTMDLDFPAILAHTRAKEPGVILFRMFHPKPKLIQERLEYLFKTHMESEIACSITTIEDSRIRIRPLPIK